MPGMAHGPPPHIVSTSFGGPDAACAAKVERSRVIPVEPQEGQRGVRRESPARTRNSAVFPQAVQRYSRRGMGNSLRGDSIRPRPYGAGVAPSAAATHPPPIAL